MGPIQLDVDQQAESEHASGGGTSAKPAPAAESPSNTHKELEMGSAQHEACSEGSSARPSSASPQPESSDGELVNHAEKLTLHSEPLESSTATVKPVEAMQPADREPSPPAPPPKDDVYLDPTPKTPSTSQPLSRTPSYASSALEHSEELKDDDPDMSKGSPPMALDADPDEKLPPRGLGEGEEGSRSEIQSIIGQFDDEGGGPGVEEVMSPRLELASSSMGGHIHHPPRKSSLEPIASSAETGLGLSGIQGSAGPPLSPKPTRSSDSLQVQREINPPVPPKPSSILGMSPPVAPVVQFASGAGAPKSPMSPTHHKPPPPPRPDPEPDLPFDFHRFLEQLRHKTADPVAKFLRSFLQEFGKKQWMVHEQVKIISDFLAFITNKMAQCEVWRGVSDAEFDNAREGMEKLVMNRLYTQTFSPAIPPPQLAPVAGQKGKRKGPEGGPGRRGQHQEDVERDEVLAQKVRIYGWVREEHLDIETVGESGRRFLTLAQQELLKIKTYRAPRDKVICVLNCCKVIFGLLRHSKSDQSADSFVPLLIYVVLQANPEHLVSNVQYILRFRNSEKLGGEAGYYLSSLMGAIQFIENLDRTSLTIADKEFETNVEAAVSAIAEKHEEQEKAATNHVRVPEKSSISKPEVTPRTSMDVEYSSPKRSSSRDRTKAPSGVEHAEEMDAVAGLLRTIQRPLSTIGRMFSEEPSSSPQSTQRSPNLAPVQPAGRHPVATPPAGNTPRVSPAPPLPNRNNGETRWEASEMGQVVDLAQKRERVRLSAEESAARQASAETAEAQRIQRAEHADVVEVGLAVDVCLTLSS
ncbi:hypothetical protein GP486_005490 [Trichoglossum hirsutum]|uniref:VPS9 domain-containing protein n=1 Tax=Trichoglossum hirsutum TaxID=265104 RepID=A0A9P8RMJ4_9PEZI|nr:hypothetical protein GP486_005490 [Trichoglossum hirsutum]